MPKIYPRVCEKKRNAVGQQAAGTQNVQLQNMNRDVQQQPAVVVVPREATVVAVAVCESNAASVTTMTDSSVAKTVDDATDLPKFCTKCGAKRKGHGVFCDACGAKVSYD